MRKKPPLNAEQRELIAIGASIGGDCLPFLRYRFAEAIKAVNQRPTNDVFRLADDLLSRELNRERTVIDKP